MDFGHTSLALSFQSLSSYMDCVKTANVQKDTSQSGSQVRTVVDKMFRIVLCSEIFRCCRSCIFCLKTKQTNKKKQKPQTTNKQTQNSQSPKQKTCEHPPLPPLLPRMTIPFWSVLDVAPTSCFPCQEGPLPAWL